MRRRSFLQDLSGEQMLGCAAFMLAMMLIIAVVTIGACGGLNIEYSRGTRSGVIQKISKKGMIWSTWEGELNLGYSRSNSDGNGINPEIFHFSCSSDEIAQDITAAEEAGGRVTVEYRQYLFRGYKYGKTGYDIVAVRTH